MVFFKLRSKAWHTTSGHRSHSVTTVNDSNRQTRLVFFCLQEPQVLHTRSESLTPLATSHWQDIDSQSVSAIHDRFTLQPWVAISHTRKHGITSTAIRLLVGDFTTTKVAMFPWPRKQHGTGFSYTARQLLFDHFKRDSHETQLSDSVTATSLIIRCFLN